MAKKVFVSGCYDLLHSGHVEFFREASQYGDLYVGIGSDATIQHYKHHKTVYSEQERLFMVRSIRYVKDACVNAGDGFIDFLPSLDAIQPDVFVVNSDGHSDEKARICRERGIEYVVLERKPAEGLTARSSTDLKKSRCQLPTRLDLAGTWIDQPSLSALCPGWAITLSLEPSFEVRERCGLSTSTRNVIKSIWPYQLPNMDPETLARLVFCFENHPEREGGHVSGAQDAIGICVPGVCRHYYDGHFWPERIETCNDEKVLDWLEAHLCMVPLAPRPAGCSVVEGKEVSPEKVKALALAAAQCWEAMLVCDLAAFAAAYRASFSAQVAMFPGMVDPAVVTQKADGTSEVVRHEEHSVRPAIAQWSATEGVLAWKMPGAGGGGYLALVVDDAAQFCACHAEAIALRVRRPGM